MRGEKNFTEEWAAGAYGRAVIDYELDDDGIINLLEAILYRAGQDYMNELPIDGNITPEQRKIESFVRMMYGSEKGQGIIDTLRRNHPLLNKAKKKKTL